MERQSFEECALPKGWKGDQVRIGAHQCLIRRWPRKMAGQQDHRPGILLAICPETFFQRPFPQRIGVWIDRFGPSVLRHPTMLDLQRIVVERCDSRQNRLDRPASALIAVIPAGACDWEEVLGGIRHCHQPRGEIWKLVGKFAQYAAFETGEVSNNRRIWRDHRHQSFRTGSTGVRTTRVEELMVRDGAVPLLQVKRELERHLLIGTRAHPAGDSGIYCFKVQPCARPSPFCHGGPGAVDVVEGCAGASSFQYPRVERRQRFGFKIEHIVDAACAPFRTTASGQYVDRPFRSQR